MKIMQSAPYGIHSGAARTSGSLAQGAHASGSGALVSGVSPRASSAIFGIAEATFAVALWAPVGFKERHPIWGTLFGAGAAFNLLDALLP